MDAAEFERFLVTVPASPGVYLFRDREDRVLYVGKALSLRNRLRSYAPGPSTPGKAEYLVDRAVRVETIVTRAEYEALILEYSLIKQHRPPQNVIWRDNKSYPYLELTMADEFPRLYFVRRIRKPGARYFGPFTTRTARQAQRMANRVLRVPSCRVPMDGRQVPCLYHHLDWCDAPCAGLVPRESYAVLVRQARLFLEGKRGEVAAELEDAMKAAADREDFEEAARLRDRFRAVREILEEQAVVDPNGGDAEVVAVARSGAFACLALLSIRAGKLQGKEEFVVRGVKDETDGDLLEAFLGQHFGQPRGDGTPGGPLKLVMPCAPSGEEVVRAWLAERVGGPVEFRIPERGHDRELMDIALANARAALITRGRVDEAEARDQLEAACRELGLGSRPERIEAVDLSQLGGEEEVGAVVVFREGQPSPREYRKFLVKTARGGDDYAAMREVVSRRLIHLAEDGKTPPDLLLLDGGATHLAAVEEVLAGMKKRPGALAALAKREELLWVSGRQEPVRLPADDPALLLLMRVRDEAHRFANAYQRKRRSMALRESAGRARKPSSPRPSRELRPQGAPK